MTSDQASAALAASHRRPALTAGDRTVRLVAHRGSGHAHNDPNGPPENTLAAVRYGYEQGADAVEIDVWRTSDGVVVLHHDATTDRTTDIVGRHIEASTYAELAGSAGLWKGDQWATERIPTLAQTRGATLVVEIVGGPQVVDDVVGASPSEAVFICKNLDTAAEVKRASGRPVLWIVDTTPRWQIGGWAQGHRRGTANERVGFDDHADAEWLAEAALERGIDGLDTMFSYPPGMPQTFAAAGLRWMVWTANDPRAIDMCLLDGAWGITTDNTAVVAGWLRDGGYRTAREAGAAFW